MDSQIEINDFEWNAKFYGNSTTIVTRVVMDRIPGVAVIIGNQQCGSVPNLQSEVREIEIVC